MRVARLLAAFALVLLCVRPCAPASADAAGNAVWRAGGYLTAADGHHYAYVADFFRYRTGTGVRFFSAQATLIDDATGRRYNARTIDREPIAGEHVATRGDTIDDGTWRLMVPSPSGRASALRLDLPGVRLDVSAASRKRAVTLDLGGGASTFWSALTCRAILTLGNERVALAGKGWLERAGAGEASAPARGVDERFVAQLDDGREILVESRGPTASDAQPRAALIARNGAVELLRPEEYGFGVGPNIWHSTHSSSDYPDQWGVTVFGRTEALLLEPLVIDQESDGEGAGANFYEAAYDVVDNTPGSMGARLGSAYGLLLGFRNPGAMP